MSLVGRQGGVSAVRRYTHLQRTLQAVVIEHRAAQHSRQLSRGKTAEQLHLPQPVLRGDIALRVDEVVH